MQTKGITHAHTRKLLLLLALIATLPAWAQVKSYSQAGISFATVNNQATPVNAGNELLAAPTSDQRTGNQKPVSLPADYKNEMREGNDDFTVKSGNGRNLNLAGSHAASIEKNLAISFSPTSFVYPEGSTGEVGIADYPTGKLLLYAIVLKQYARQNGLDTTYAFLSNMGMLSSKKRFFVINLVTMQIEQSGMVSQGRGQGRTKYDKQYSNIVESKCTSLGRYKISNRYRGSYGESYRLVGLDSSNQNALKRNIVLHPMGCIPDEESMAPTCISEGCPAVSPNFLSGLSKIIDTRQKPVLLWVFDSNLEEVIAAEIPTENKYHICSIHIRETHDLP